MSRSDERPLGTLVLYYAVSGQHLELFITHSSQPGVAQRPAESELVSTAGGRRVRATDRFVSYWDGNYLYTIISPGLPSVPGNAIVLVDLLE